MRLVDQRTGSLPRRTIAQLQGGYSGFTVTPGAQADPIRRSGVPLPPCTQRATLSWTSPNGDSHCADMGFDVKDSGGSRKEIAIRL